MMFLDLVKEYDGQSVSFYLDSEFAESFVDEIVTSNEKIFEEYIIKDLYMIVNENDIVIITKDENDVYFVEGLYGVSDQKFNEVDVALIQDEIVDCIDTDRIACDELLSISIERIEESSEYGNDELLEDITEDILVDLVDEANCPHCVIKEALSTVWEMAYAEAMENMAESI